MLSDGRSAALLTPGGEIDWWCWPRMHSRPLCWTLLDPAGGFARWGGGRHAELRGAPAGTTARRTLRIGDDLVELWDGMLPGRRTSGLVRLVRNRDRDLDVCHELALGGFDGPRARWCGNRAEIDGDVVLRVTGGITQIVDGTARTRVRAGRGQWALLSIAESDADPDIDDTITRLRECDDAELARLDASAVPRQHEERARAALAVLHACTDRQTGAVVASPTTSLPETVGGDRQFDYRYTWLRDSSMAVTVALLLGQRDVARRYLGFVEEIGPEHLLDAPVRNADGGEVPPEREIRDVSGWFGSQPVRVGNDATEQLQYDAPAFVVDAIYVYSRMTHRLSSRSWEIVRALADRATNPSPRESNGIWELREPADLVSGDVGRWLTLDRAIRLARRRRPWARRRAWRRERSRTRQRVLRALRPDGTIPLEYGGDRVDAAGLLVVTCGLLPSSDPRAGRLVHATLRALGAGPFVHRYPPDGADGFSPDEAPFVPTSWWAVTALAVIGDAAAARRRTDDLCAALPPLLAEEFEPARGEALGNTPLVWSHAECARALFSLDEQQRFRNRVKRGAGRMIREWWRAGTSQSGEPDKLGSDNTS